MNHPAINFRLHAPEDLYARRGARAVVLLEHEEAIYRIDMQPGEDEGVLAEDISQGYPRGRGDLIPVRVDVVTDLRCTCLPMILSMCVIRSWAPVLRARAIEILTLLEAHPECAVRPLEIDEHRGAA